MEVDLHDFEKLENIMNQGKTQCWALFVISKATFRKTAIKPKCVDRFSLKIFSVTINQCSIKPPNFVSIEIFLICLTQVQNWANQSDVIDLATFFPLGFPFVSSLTQHRNPMQDARIYLAWLPSVIYLLLLSFFLQHYHISERFQRATRRGKFSRAAWEIDVMLNSR